MIRLYRFLRPFRAAIAAILVLVLLQPLSNLYLPTLTADIVDKGIVHKDIAYILRVGGVMLLIAAGGTICSLAASFLSSTTAVGFGRIVRSQIFGRVESFSLHEFDQFGTATLITRTTNDVTQVQTVTVIILRMMVSAPLMMIGGLILALLQDRPLTLVLAVSVPVLMLVIVFLLRRTLPLFHLMHVTLAGGARGFVAFEHVTFRYPGAEQPALSDISFHARPGEVTAIIGGTGSGKSTLVNLIARFYDVASGRILVDGVDVREMAQADLRARIGFVPQKTALFSGTIADNIRYGKDDATEQEAAHAAETAQATEFISGMASGFGSWIAQGGANVSGGQKQRLSIARALGRE